MSAYGIPAHTTVLEGIATGTQPLGVGDSALQQHVRAHITWQALKTDPSLYSSSTTLQNFLTAGNSGAYGRMWRIDSCLGAGDVAAAKTEIGGWSARANVVEDNAYTFYGLYLRYVVNQSLNSSDSATLFSIARKCPLRDGLAVYDARSLFNYVYMLNEAFEGSCSPDGLGKPGRSEEESEISAGNEEFGAYPNPTTGELSIIFPVRERGDWQLLITNAVGQVVRKSVHKANVTTLQTSINGVPGLYLVQATNTATGESYNVKVILK